MKIKRIWLSLVMIVVMLSLTGCERELPNSIEVKDYLTNKFISGYELEYLSDGIDDKGYHEKHYKVRLRDLDVYNITFKVICSSKEDILNLSGIRDTFSKELRAKYLKENILEYEIENTGEYSYRVKLEKDLSKYENVNDIIRYLVYFESKYIRYEESFYKEHPLNDMFYKKILNGYSGRRISSKIILTINDKVEIRLWEYANTPYKESKEKYEFYYKALQKED